MRIAYNPITEAALTTAPDNNDITFDLKGLNIFVKGVKFKGTDTTYQVFKKHTSSSGGGYNGLVPVPSYTSTNVRFLREDGTWQIPSSQYTYSQLTNQDLDTLKTEGKWYYLGEDNTVTNGPSNINSGGELYVGRNANGYRYQKVILLDGVIWFRIWNGTQWADWKRWYTDANTDSKVLQSNTTTANYRPIILGYNNNADHNNISSSVTQQVYTTTSIYAQPSTGSLWATKLYSGGQPVLTQSDSSNYVTLNTNQTITGQKTFSTQQKFTVGTGTSPFTVTSSTVVSNLNADLLDGYHIINSFLYTTRISKTIDPTTDIYVKITIDISYSPEKWPILIDLRYDNRTGLLYLDLDTVGASTYFNYYCSNYNGSNIIGAAKAFENSKLVLYLKLKQSTSATSATLNCYSPKNGSIEVIQSASVSFKEIKPGYHRGQYIGTFVKEGSSDSYVLLGGGGHKALSEFSMTSHNHDSVYVKKAGDTMTGNLSINKANPTICLTSGWWEYSKIEFNHGTYQDEDWIGGIVSSSFGSAKLVGKDTGTGELSGNTHGMGFINARSDLGGWHFINKSKEVFYVHYTGDVKAKGNIQSNGYIKNNSSDSYVLLGGGGHKQISDFAIASHTHGLLHSDFTVMIENTTTDSGWSMINNSYRGFILKSIRTQGSAPNWLENNYSAGICFGGSDTKGVLSVAYDSPKIKFAGGNSTTPKWYLQLTGLNGKSYNLENFSASSHNHDDRYVNVTGDTMTGTLRLPADKSLASVGNLFIGNTKIGSTTTTDSFGIYAGDNIFLRPSSLTGELTYGLIITKSSLTYNNVKVWHASNDGHNSGLDADTLDTHHASDFMLKSDEINNNVTTITKTLNVTSSWMDTGIAGNNLETGTYIIQLLVNDSTSFWSTYHSGIMSWYKDNTNDSETDEIILHRAGHAYSKAIYLRTVLTANGNGGMKLQIAASSGIGAEHTYTFKFKRVI